MQRDRKDFCNRMRNNFFLILDDGRMSVTGTGFCREKIWHPSTFWGQTRRKLLIGSGRDFYLKVRTFSNKQFFFSKTALIVNAVLTDSVFCIRTVVGVLDEPYSQLTPLSGVAVQARVGWNRVGVSILCSLVGR